MAVGARRDEGVHHEFFGAAAVLDQAAAAQAAAALVEAFRAASLSSGAPR